MTIRLRRFIARASLLCVLIPASPFCFAQTVAWDDGSVPFVVSPDEVVDRMLRIAQVREGDRLIDLGSGDGRIVIEAARRGARALGVDIEPDLVMRARANAVRAGVAEKVRFEVRDLFETDLSSASVITMYLLPEFNLKLKPRLLALAPGTRIVSHDWDMGPWKPDETTILPVPEKSVGADRRSFIFLWVVPADARGTWHFALAGHGDDWRLVVKQEYQVLTIGATVQGRDLVVRGARLRGNEIRLSMTGVVGTRAANHLFSGHLRGGRIDGRVVVSNGDEQRILPWTATRTH